MVVYIVAFLIFVIIASLVYFLFGSSDPKKLFENGKVAAQNGDWNGVIKVFTKFLKTELDDPVPYYYLGLAHYNKKQYEKSSNFFLTISSNHLQNEDVSDLMVYPFLADCYLAMGDEKEATRYYLLNLEVKPNDPEALFKVGKLYFKSEQFPKSLEYLKKCIEFDKQYKAAFPLIGYIHHKSKQFDEAFKYLKASEKLGVDMGKVCYHLGDVMVEMENHKESTLYFEKALKEKYITHLTQRRLGEAYQQLGNFEKASIHYGSALELYLDGGKKYSDINDIRYELANVYRQMGKIQEAYQLWNDISKVDPGYKDVTTKLKTMAIATKNKKVSSIYSMSYEEFTLISKKILSKLHHNIKEVEKVDNEEIIIRSTYVEKNLEVDCLNCFSRTTNTVGDLKVKDFIRRIREEKIYKGVYYTTTFFTESAKEVTLTSPVDLVEGKDFAKQVESVKS